MARQDFWKSDWFLGVAVAVAVLVVSRTDLIQSLAREAYDLGLRGSDRVPSERIAVIAIDDSSIANIGRWPWPRDVHAKLMYTHNPKFRDLENRNKIANEQPINPVRLNPALPDYLVGIINRALAKQTQERYATGDQMAKAVRECAGVFGMVDVAL